MDYTDCNNKSCKCAKDIGFDWWCVLGRWKNKNEVLVETSSENNKKTREGEKDNSPLYSV